MRKDDIEVRWAEIDRYRALAAAAVDALAEVLAHLEVGGYVPQLKALFDALDWLETEVTCGDCIEGRCHWGGQASRDSIAAVKAGQEYHERCGCARHEASVEARIRAATLKSVRDRIDPATEFPEDPEDCEHSRWNPDNRQCLDCVHISPEDLPPSAGEVPSHA
jgi:hypothetical protein